MNEQIKYQKNLMLYALLQLEKIEAINSGFFEQPLDRKEAENQYAETMATLAGELAKIGTYIPHDQISH